MNGHGPNSAGEHLSTTEYFSARRKMEKRLGIFFPGPPFKKDISYYQSRLIIQLNNAIREKIRMGRRLNQKIFEKNPSREQRED